MPTPQPSPAPEPTDDELDAQLNGEATPPTPKPASPKPGAPRTAPRPANNPQPAPPAPAPTGHQHSQESLALADMYGFDPLDVDGWSPQELDRRLHRRHLQDLARRQQNYPQPAPVNPAPQPAAPEDDPWDRMIADPVQAKFFRDREQQQRAEVAELKKQLAERAESDKHRAVRETKERLDTAFAKLPADFYGEQTFDELYAENPSHPLIRRRNALLTAAGVDLSKPLPPAGVLDKRLAAAEAILRPQPAQPEPDDDVVEVPSYGQAQEPPRRRHDKRDPVSQRFTRQEWDEAGLMRPSRRNGKPAAEDYGPSGTIAPDEFDLGPDDLR